MDSKFLAAALCLVVLLGGCSWWGDDDNTVEPTEVAVPANDQGYADDANLTYWHPTHVTADNVPDPVRAQHMLEDDLVACGYELRDHRRWAADNDPVSNAGGDVVDKNGVNRSDTSLPTTFTLRDCMATKGWVPLKHYYTTPY